MVVESMAVNFFFAMLPLCGLATQILIHVLLSRVLPEHSPWRLQFIGFCLGLLLTIFLVILIVNENDMSTSTLISTLIIDIGTVVSLGFCYFTFVNLNYTSLRIRLLREFVMHGGKLNLADILQEYSTDAILNTRLVRLLNAGELQFDGKYYYLGTQSRFRMIGSLLEWFKCLLNVGSNRIERKYIVRFSDIILSAFVVLGIFWMPLYLYLTGITISTYLEESVGYRYFYSLRLAFGHEAAWLPQGQLVTLYHILIQRFLTLFGLPNDQLFPRVDIFCMIANALPIILSWFAFVRLSSSFDCKSWPFLVGAILVFMMQSMSLPGGPSWPMMPDYHVWVIPLAIFTASLLPKFGRETELLDSKKIYWFVGMGVLTGMAGCIKITFMLFPLTVLGVWIVSSWDKRKTPVMSMYALISCLLTVSIILWATTDFGGKIALKKYLLQSIYFFRDQPSTMPAVVLPHFESLFTPLLSVIATFYGIKNRYFSMAVIGLGCLIYTIFLGMRFYSHSLIEYYAFLMIPLVPLARICSYRTVFSNFQKTTQFLGQAITCFAFIIFAYSIQQSWPSFMRDIPAEYQELSRAANEFHKRLEAEPFPIWILTTDNNYRPNSIESALCKGGMDINNNQWGASPYMVMLFPKFHCAIGSLRAENRKKIPYSTIGFSHLANESLPVAITRIEKIFDISLSNSTCQDIYGYYRSPFTYCYPRSYDYSQK